MRQTTAAPGGRQQQEVRKDPQLEGEELEIEEGDEDEDEEEDDDDEE